MINLARFIEDTWHRLWSESVLRATVTGTSGQRVSVSSEKLTGTFPKLSSYTPSVGDEVLIVRVGTGWIVIGKVVR